MSEWHGDVTRWGEPGLADEIKKPALPTTPGSLVSLPTGYGSKTHYSLGTDGLWYPRHEAWSPQALAARDWTLEKDAGS